MSNLENVVTSLILNKTVTNIAVRVGRKNQILTEYFSGNTDKNTLFDMASVTKIFAPTTLSLIAMDKGLLSPSDEVCKFVKCAGQYTGLTVKNLMTHTMGIGHKNLTQGGFDYNNIEELIFSITPDVPIGTDVRYSCPGYIILGKIAEKIFAEPLDVIFKKYVAEPLGMQSSQYRPVQRENIINSNIDDKMLGIVNDYNCRYLGGVSGNAGIFSNLEDTTLFAKMLLNKGTPLISKETFDMARKNYTENMSESRALGFVYVDEKYKQTGFLFARGSIGHCGHTGQSVFVDIENDLYAIILSDATVSTIRKYGKENYAEVINMREQIHNAILNDLR